MIPRYRGKIAKRRPMNDGDVTARLQAVRIDALRDFVELAEQIERMKKELSVKRLVVEELLIHDGKSIMGRIGKGANGKGEVCVCDLDANATASLQVDDGRGVLTLTGENYLHQIGGHHGD